MSRSNIQRLRLQRDDFNARVSVGQRVIVDLGQGNMLFSATGSEAIIRHDHAVVVWVSSRRNIGQFHPLDRVTPVFALSGRRGTIVTDEGQRP